MSDNHPAWLKDGLPYIWQPYAQMSQAPLPLPVVAADGVRIQLADGQTLIDGTSSWWTACHGYNHPHLRRGIEAQLSLPHIMFGGLAHEPAFHLAQRLAKLLPDDLDHIFFSESGSVSVEIALKLALQYWRNQGDTQRLRFLSFRGGYHGDTFEAMSITDPDIGMHHAWQANLNRHCIVDLPITPSQQHSFETFLQQRHTSFAAVIVEPLVQGAGGMRFHDGATLQYLRKSCDRYGILLIFDEIMTGFGRTGHMFACEEANVTPDIICLSKALTGGTLPLAATVARQHVFDTFLSDRQDHAFMHGPTFMANALACAAANASLDLFTQEPRLQQVAAIEQQLHEELAACRQLPQVVDVRVKGAIGVVQLKKPITGLHLRHTLMQQGVWLRPFGNIVYVMPAFVISPEDLHILTQAVYTALEQTSRCTDNLSNDHNMV